MFLLSLCDSHYLATGLLVGLFDLLPLLVAPFHQNFNNGVLIHTCKSDNILTRIIMHLCDRHTEMSTRMIFVL